MKREKEKIAGLVLAAGRSTRMGSFKPLLPLGDSTVLEKAVGSLLSAGVHDVGVVVGWRAEEILPVIARLGVKPVHNPRFDSGMYSSVVAGVRSLAPEIEAFLLLPGDYPMVKPHTVQDLVHRYLVSEAGIVYPRFQGRRGHPPVVEKRYLEGARDFDRPGGLRAVLTQYESDALDVDVFDRGVIMDLDVYDDYLKVLALSRGADSPA